MEHESFENDDGRRGAQRALRVDQGRSRGAARRRSRLHDVRAGDDRIRRLADERVADAGSQAVLRRHVFSAVVAVGHGPGSSTSCRRSPACGAPSARKVDRVGRCGHRASCESLEQAAPAADVPGADALEHDGAAVPRRVRSRGTAASATRRSFRGRRELLFLLREHARTGDAEPREMVLAHAARDGARRHARSHRRRLPSLLGGRRVARAALREDAVRPGAARARVTSRRRRCRAIRSISRSPRTRCSTSMREMTDAAGGFYSAEDADSIPPEQAGDAGRRTRRRARSTCGAPPSSTRCSATTRTIVQAPVRHRAGRQRAAGSAAGVHRQEPALRRALDRRTCGDARP